MEGVNALADAAPGFVWRQDDDGDATRIAVFGDASLIINLSVWRSVQELKDFVFTGLHAEGKIVPFRENGCGPDVFSLNQPFPPPDHE